MRKRRREDNYSDSDSLEELSDGMDLVTFYSHFHIKCDKTFTSPEINCD